MALQPLKWNTLLYLPLNQLREVAVKSPELSEIVSSPEFWKQRLVIDFPKYANEFTPLEPNNWQQLYSIVHRLLSDQQKANDLHVSAEVSRSFGYPDSAFEQVDERTEELNSVEDDRGEYWQPNVEMMTWLFEQGLQKGDLVTFEAGAGYRNDARWYYIGDGVLRIDFEPDDYGTCPRELPVLTEPEWRPIDYWVREGESMNAHNWIVRFDLKPYREEIEKNVYKVESDNDYEIYATCFRLPIGLKINLYSMSQLTDLEEILEMGAFHVMDEDIDLPSLDPKTTLYAI